LEESIDNLVDVLVDANQVIVNEVPLAQLDPLFALLFLALQLIDIVDVVILARALRRLLRFFALAASGNDGK